jgi:hypothetical protein
LILCCRFFCDVLLSAHGIVVLVHYFGTLAGEKVECASAIDSNIPILMIRLNDSSLGGSVLSQLRKVHTHYWDSSVPLPRKVRYRCGSARHHPNYALTSKMVLRARPKAEDSGEQELEER